MDPVLLQAILAHKQTLKEKASGKGKKLTPEQAEVKRRRLWVTIAKKEIPKVRKFVTHVYNCARKYCCDCSSVFMVFPEHTAKCITQY